MKPTIDGRKISHKMFSTESVEWVFSLMLMHKLIGKYVATFFSLDCLLLLFIKFS